MMDLAGNPSSNIWSAPFSLSLSDDFSSSHCLSFSRCFFALSYYLYIALPLPLSACISPSTASGRIHMDAFSEYWPLLHTELLSGLFLSNSLRLNRTLWWKYFIFTPDSWMYQPCVQLGSGWNIPDNRIIIHNSLFFPLPYSILDNLVHHLFALFDTKECSSNKCQEMSDFLNDYIYTLTLSALLFSFYCCTY